MNGTAQAKAREMLQKSKAGINKAMNNGKGGDGQDDGCVIS